MISLSIPDINVWLAILLADHVHRDSAREWWEQDSSDVLAFVRLTQMGLLRLLTTAAAMNNQPLSMSEAWGAYDRLFHDDRVAFLDEPRGLELHFRRHTEGARPSPKLWADAWLLAFAELSGGVMVTFDRALAQRRPNSIHLS